MENFYFDTNGFQDSVEKLKENCNEIGGFGLSEVLQSILKKHGFQNDDIFDEDYGWAFDAQLNNVKYFCTASVDPVDDETLSDYSHFANINVERKRSFLEKLKGTNKITIDDPAIKAVHLALTVHADVHNLKSSLF